MPGSVAGAWRFGGEDRLSPPAPAVGKLAVLLLVTSLAAGCGYRLVGSAGARPNALWIGPVADDSREPLLGAHVRAALAREAVDRADASLATRDQASALLSVRLLSTQETAVAFVAGDKPRQYLLAAEVDATLTARDGKVLWKGTKLRVDRQFDGGETVEKTEQNKQQALQLLAGDLGREILRRVSLVLDTTLTPP